MAYKSILEVDGKKFRLESLEFGAFQHADATGRPSTEVFAGTINMSIEMQPDHTFMWDWAIRSSEQKDGSITIVDPKVKGGEFKKLEFTKAYCTAWTTSVVDQGTDQMYEQITLMCHSLKFSGSEFLNPWETFAD